MKNGNMKILETAAMASLVCLLFIGSAGAWDENDLNQLLTLRHCPSCDLRGADLSGKNLSWHNFTYADLKNANMSNSNLTGASFAGASFAGANLRGANLNGAILDRTNFSGAASWLDDDFLCASPSIGGCYPECSPGSVCY